MEAAAEVQLIESSLTQTARTQGSRKPIQGDIQVCHIREGQGCKSFTALQISMLWPQCPLL